MNAKKLPIEDLETITFRAQDSFLKLNNSKIFITGGTGFFGKWLLASLLYAKRKISLNVEIWILTRDQQKFLDRYPWFNEFNYIEGDIVSFQFPEISFDYIIHAAADVSTSEVKDPESFLKGAIDGGKRIIELAKKSNAKKILFTSSGAIYGKATSQDENFIESLDLPLELSPYGEAKKRVEELFKTCGMNYLITRCFAFIGPELPLNGSFAAGNFLNDLVSGKEIQIKGNGAPLRSYMYMSDFCIWIWKLLVSEKINEVVNIGSDEVISIKNLAFKMNDLLEGKGVSIFDDKPPAEILKYVPCIEKAKTMFDLDLKVSLDEAILKTSRWLNN